MFSRKHLIGILFSLPLFLLLFSAGAQAADCHSTGTEWKNSAALPTDPGTYYLTTDVTLTGTWMAPADTTLCLNGHTVSGNGTFRLIYSSGALTIKNCVTDEVGGYGYWNSSGTYCFSHTPPASGAYDTLPAGILFGGMGSKIPLYVNNTNGGGIYAEDSLTLSGVTIAGCTGTNGGGIYTTKDLTLTNVTFASCSGTKGGCVYITKSPLTASGCVFANNRATDRAAALHLSSDNATAELSNCSFRGNQCTGNAGGACYLSCSSAALTGCTFTGNSAGTFGGALCLNAGAVALTDTAVTGNTAFSSGGGIAVYSDAGTTPPSVSLTINGGSIQDNIASFQEGSLDPKNAGLGGGICVCSPNPVTITLNGPTITGNTASRAGGGIATASTYYSSATSPASTTIIIGSQTTITGNTAAGEPSNLEIRNKYDKTSAIGLKCLDITLSPADALTTARVGISAKEEAVFAAGFPAGIFTADAEDCDVLLSGGNASIHRHAFSDYVSDNNATCTTDGTKTASCSGCGQKITVSDPDTKTDHSLGDWSTTTAPTYLTPGEETRSCANGCGLTETRPVPATGTATAEAITLNYDSSSRTAMLINPPEDILIFLAGYENQRMVFFTVLTPASGGTSVTLPASLTPDTLQAMFLTQSYQPIGPCKTLPLS